MAAVKGLRGGDFRKEILPRPLTDDKPERQGEEQTSDFGGGVGLSSQISKWAQCPFDIYRREENKLKMPANP